MEPVTKKTASYDLLTCLKTLKLMKYATCPKKIELINGNMARNH